MDHSDARAVLTTGISMLSGISAFCKFAPKQLARKNMAEDVLNTIGSHSDPREEYDRILDALDAVNLIFVAIRELFELPEDVLNMLEKNREVWRIYYKLMYPKAAALSGV